MNSLPADAGHHEASQVLTGAVFDILLELVNHYRLRRPTDGNRQVLARVTKRLRRLVVQALDLLPPVDVTFNDFALAMFRADTLVHPVDP